MGVVVEIKPMNDDGDEDALKMEHDEAHESIKLIDLMFN